MLIVKLSFEYENFEDQQFFVETHVQVSDYFDRIESVNTKFRMTHECFFNHKRWNWSSKIKNKIKALS